MMGRLSSNAYFSKGVYIGFASYNMLRRAAAHFFVCALIIFMFLIFKIQALSTQGAVPYLYNYLFTPSLQCVAFNYWYNNILSGSHRYFRFSNVTFYVITI